MEVGRNEKGADETEEKPIEKVLSLRKLLFKQCVAWVMVCILFYSWSQRNYRQSDDQKAYGDKINCKGELERSLKEFINTSMTTGLLDDNTCFYDMQDCGIDLVDANITSVSVSNNYYFSRPFISAFFNKQKYLDEYTSCYINGVKKENVGFWVYGYGFRGTSCEYRLVIGLLSIILLSPFILNSLETGTIYAELVFKLFREGNFRGKAVMKFLPGDQLMGKENLCRYFCLFPFYVLGLSVIVVLILFFFPILLVLSPFALVLCCSSRRALSAFLRALSGIVGCLLFVFLWLPELALAFLLPTLSFMIIIDSDSIDNVVVNVVAFQIFSQMDELITSLVCNRQLSLGKALAVVFVDAEKPKTSMVASIKEDETGRELYQEYLEVSPRDDPLTKPSNGASL